MKARQLEIELDLTVEQFGTVRIFFVIFVIIIAIIITVIITFIITIFIVTGTNLAIQCIAS